MNILLCGNTTAFEGFKLVICSILKHNSHINFFIFSGNIDIEVNDHEAKRYLGLSEQERDKLVKLVKWMDSSSNIEIINVEQHYYKYLKGNLNENVGFTPYAPIRLLADIVLPYLNEILFLDLDIAVNGSLLPLYTNYINDDYDYAAFTLPEGKEHAGEMVAGVLMFNLKRIRKSGFLKRARENLFKNRYTWYDQDALSEAGKPLPIPEDYNYMRDVSECVTLPTILHFTYDLTPKIYDADMTPSLFYRKFPFLKHIEETLKLFETINL